MKLALGTVQFGLPYGVANRHGKPSVEEVAAILECARQAGMDVLDTAAAYGESESVLGRFDLQGWRVVTKLPALPAQCENISAWVKNTFQASLQKLGLSSVDGLLLHRPIQLLDAQGAELARSLQALREEGLVRQIGISVYGPTELDALADRLPLDLVQAPFNVLDRGMLSSGWLQRLKDKGVEVHARSAFLQGLLLMAAAERPPRFAAWQELWDAWHAWLRDTGQTAYAAALGFVLNQACVDKVVVGVDSAAQLQDLIEAARAPYFHPPAGLTSTDPLLINPSTWNQA